MKKFFLLATILILASTLILADNYFVFAKKSKKKEIPKVEGPAVQAINTGGETTIYGSVLDPSVNQVLLLLPKQLLNIIRKMGSTRISTNVVSTLDSTKTFKVLPSAISIQRRKVKSSGPSAVFLVVNVSSLTTPSDVTITPGTLPSGDYRIRITGENIDISSKSIRYHTPVLIVGTVKSKNTGYVTVEDLSGKIISEKTVAISPNGIFITEVRVNKIKENKNNNLSRKSPNTKSQKNEKGPLVETLGNGDIGSLADSDNSGAVDTALVHAVTEKDLYALTPLDNSIQSNTTRAKKPLELSEGTSLTANIGKEYEELAETVAEEELKKLQQGEEIQSFEDFGCDVFKFANRCTEDNEDVYVSIGADFKNFLQTESCSFPEFDLVKQIISEAPEETNVFIGKGYCEYALSSFEDERRPCEEYTQILSEFESGLLGYLPCPPRFCTEFSYIRPPKCQVPQGFCSAEQIESLSSSPVTTKICRGSKCKPIIQGCVIRPVTDPFCGRIGTDLSEFECLNQDIFTGVSWTTVTNSKGNTYCVPKEVVSFAFGQTLTPEEIGEECEVSACHKKCEEDFRQTKPINFTPAYPNERCEVCDCHVHCDVEAGRFYDCTGGNVDLFSVKCCGKEVYSPSIPRPSLQPGTGRVPVRNNITGCLCSDPNNFQENGLAKEEAVDICVDSCPENYEVDPFNDNICVPICEEGTFRDPNGICRKKCPPGLLEDESGSCTCPRGFVIGPSGRCEPSRCPEFCKEIQPVRKYLEQIFGGNISDQPEPEGTPSGYGPGSSDPGESSEVNEIPPECLKCFGGGNISRCPEGFRRDPDTRNCVREKQCAEDQYIDQDGNCRCVSNDKLANSPNDCKTQSQCESNLLPNNTPGEASCVCPSYLPYWDGANCVSQCPPGTSPSINFSALPRSPTPCTSTHVTCPPNQYLYQGTCVSSCPFGLIPGVYSFSYPSSRATLKALHDSVPKGPSPSSQLECLCQDGTRPQAGGSCIGLTSQCPPATPYRCPDGTCVISSVNCSSSRKCEAGEIPSVTGCSCASPGYISGPALPCQCPPGYGIAYSSQGCGSQLRYCSTSEIPAPLVCQCAPPAAPTGLNGTCQCPTIGQPYSATGCGPFTLPFCLPGQSAINPPSVCSCPSGSLPTGSNGTCQCTNGQIYTGIPCSTTSTPPPMFTPTPMPTFTPPTGPVAGIIDLEIRGITKGTFHSYGFNVNLCVNGPYSFNDFKAQNSSLGLTYIPVSYFVYDTFGIKHRGGVGVSGTIENIKNGQCLAYGTVIQTSDQPYFDQTQKVDFTADPDYKIFESNETNNTSSYFGFVQPFTPTPTPMPPPIYTPTPTPTPPPIYTPTPTPTPPPVYTPTPTPTPMEVVTLTSVTISGNGVTVSYSKNFDTCVHLLDLSNTPLHTTNLFCTTGFTSTTTSAFSFNSNFMSGITVKLCHGNNYNVCSPPVIVTGTLECVPGQSATNCSCASGAQPSGRYGSCLCLQGFRYFNSNYTNTCRRMCAVGEAYNSGNPCSCGPYATFSGPGGSCSCTNGRTYDPMYGCERVCTSGEISQGSDACICAGSAYYDSQNKCTCPPGQLYTTSGCTVETITLGSVSISGSSVTINFTASSLGGTNCAVLKDTFGTNQHPTLALCFNSGPISYPKDTYFIPAFQSGIQVQLCNTTTNYCSNWVTVTGSGTVPVSPWGLYAVLSGGNVVLNWTDGSNDETSFSIYRRLLGGSWSYIGSTGANITTYTDSGLATGTYEYHVNACNASGCSPDSGTTTITK